MNFYKIMNKVPAGTLLVPMLITAIINTFVPQILTAPGGMTTALFKGGSLTISALIAFAAGTGIRFREVGTIVKKSWALVAMKIVLDIVLSLLFMKLFGLPGILGINAVAFITCMCSTNPSVFISCTYENGEPSDMVISVLCICLAQAAVPLFIITSTSGAAFDIMPFLSALFPFLLGMILGNIDPELGKTFKPTTALALPFMGFCFGSSINLISAFKAGLSGILLAVVFLVLQIPCMLFADKIMGRNPGYNGAAMCSIAGTAVTVPALLTADIYMPYTPDALPQIALALIITCIVCPVVTRMVAKKWGSPNAYRT